MVEGPLTSRTILISGTHLWNPGDDFVRNGVVRILREALPEYHLNLLFYDFNPEEVRPPETPRSDNRVAPRDLAALAPAIDAVVIAGLSAGAEVEPLYHGILAAGLEDRVFLIGAGYENDYAAAWIEREPIATLFRQARIVTGRTARHPAWMDRNGVPYRHLNCPAILSVPAVRSVPPGQRIRRALFSIQLPHEGGTPNQSTGRAMFELAAQALGELRSHCEVALLAHHKSEFQHFATVGLPGSIPVLFSSFEEDLASIYPRFDLVISTRLHSALYANGHGLPAIVLNDTDRHTHCLEGFPHVTWVRDLPALRDHFAGLAALDLAQVALDLQAFKAGLLEAYVDCLRNPLLEVLRTPKRLAPLRLDDPSFDSELKEQKLLRRLVGPGMTVLDVGAHQGKYTRLLSSLVGPGGRVVAFEPTPASAQVLEARLRVAGAGNVELRREAIFSEPGTVELHEFPRTYSSWNSLGVPAMPDPEHPERLVPLAAVRQVPANSLDVFCEAAGIHQVDYLKLDVEGAERDALRGARSLLERRAIRFLQFEISRKPLEGMGRTAREVFELLAGHGYEVHAITEAGEIGPLTTDSEAFFDNYIAFPAAPGEARMPLHVFTIVLNGMPFLRYHIEMLKRLPIPWHWHVIEGVAALKHDTAWSVSRGGYISDEVHIQGRSVDGTSEYLDELAREHPGRISIYRKPRGEFWDGKLEMVNAPLAAVPDGALLWQIDADELWTVEQAVQLRELFLAEPGRTAAYFWCTYFVAPSLVVGTRNTYGNQGSIEWLRAFHFRAGCRWAAHEPPILQDAAGRNLAGLWPFRQEETEPRGLVFQHFAYADRSQLAFKESYYGYLGAIEAWERLKAVQTFPVMLRDHFPWVSDGAEVVTAESQAVQPLASLSNDGGWTFRFPADSVEASDLQAPGLGAVEHILWVRLDAIGDALRAASMLEPVHRAFPGARISVVCQPECSETYATCPLASDVWTVDRSQALQDPGYLQAVLEDLAGLRADLCIQGSNSPDALEEALASASGAPSWNPAPSPPEGNKPLKIIYVKLDAIGDAIIALDLLEKIHSHHRSCQITVVCQHHVQEIYRMMDMDLEIIPIEKSKISTDDTYIDSWIHKIQQNTYDICLHPTFSRDDFSDFLVSKIQATDKIGHYGDAVNRDPSRGRIWDTAYTTLCPQNETWKSELEHHQDFLNTLHIEGNVDIFTLKADPSLRTAFKQKLDAFFQGQRTEYLAIGWGAGWDKRRYGRMPEVIQLIQEEFPQAFGFVFLGSSTEHEAIEHLIHSHDLQDCLNLAGATTFREAAAVIDLCTLVLGAESSLAHLATALGKRSITLVGGGHFGRFLPHSHLNTLVLRPLHCYHCNWACPYENTHCIQDIHPETIVDAFKTTIINFEDTNIHLFVDESNQNDIKKPQLVHPDEIIHIDSVKCHCKSNNDPETSSIQDRPSVIIPSYQRPELLDRAITSLLNASHPIGVDVIVICNSQDAPTIQIAQSHGCRILFDDACIGPEGKFSWASAMNLGFRTTKSKWVMFGSDDIEVQNHSITKSICYAELMGDALGSVAIPHKNECLQNNYPEDTLKLHFSLSYSGLNMINYGFINKNYYKASLGFSNKYSFYASDWDLCFKIHQLSGKIIHLWDGSIKHNNTLDALKQNNQTKFINDINLLSYNWENHPIFPESRTANGAILPAANREIYHIDIALRIADLALCNRIDGAIEKTKKWLEILPDFGFLHIFMGALTMMQNPASSAIDPMFAQGQALGWEGNWRELLHNLALQYAKSVATPPEPTPRTTVFCAVWHRDPDRHALLKGHQACLDAQMIPVERIYVFDGGDEPPAWLHGRILKRSEPLAIYEAWALAIQDVRTPYVMNLNLDDRLNPDAVAFFERILDDGADLVGADWQICFSQRETDAVTLSKESATIPLAKEWPPVPGNLSRLGSGTGEQPTMGPACAWRMSLHEALGPFPARFGDGTPIRITGDLLWWRMALEAGKIIKRLPILLGRYHSHPEGQAEFRTPAEAEEEHYRRHGLG